MVELVFVASYMMCCSGVVCALGGADWMTLDALVVFLAEGLFSLDSLL